MSSTILQLVRGCEESARRILQQQGNPPDIPLISVLKPQAGRCHRMLRLGVELRRHIRKGKTRSAALAAFRLGQLGIKIMLAQHGAPKDIDLAQRVRSGGPLGGAVTRAKRALAPEKINEIKREYKEMTSRLPHLSFTEKSKKLVTTHGCGTRTVRRYLRTRRP